MDLPFRDLSSDGSQCPRLPPEPELGPVEYKLTLAAPSSDREEHLTSQLKFRFEESRDLGCRFATYWIGVTDDGEAVGIAPEALTASIATLRRMAAALRLEVGCCDFYAGTGHGQRVVAKVRVIATLEAPPLREMRIVLLGGGGAGKTTLTAVLTTGSLDNGNGSGSMLIHRHRHEIESGRTSSVSAGHFVELGCGKKLLHIVDVGGGESGYKQACKVCLGYAPSYALLCVSCSESPESLAIARDHVQLALALDIPICVAITKIDLVPDDELSACTERPWRMLSRGHGRTTELKIRTVACVSDAESFSANVGVDSGVVPIFHLSCVTGNGVEVLRAFLDLLPPPRHSMGDHEQSVTEFHICQTWPAVDDAGPIVAGIVRCGTIETGSQLLLGPGAQGQYTPVVVASIRSLNPAQRVGPGCCASLALRVIGGGPARAAEEALSTSLPSAVGLVGLERAGRYGRRARSSSEVGQLMVASSLRRGAVLVSSLCEHADASVDSAAWGFSATLLPLRQRSECPTRGTGRPNMPRAAATVVVHVSSMQQVASVMNLSGDVVTFRFKRHPEFLRCHDKVLVRDGFCAWVGKVARLEQFRGAALDSMKGSCDPLTESGSESEELSSDATNYL